MYAFTQAQKTKALYWLSFFHIVVLAVSNYLVQFPFTVLGIHSTWGALSFPFVFLTTDLTVRIFGAPLARTLIFWVMFPALLISYLVSVVFSEGVWSGWAQLWVGNEVAARIAVASFAAYMAGQLLDIKVFDRLRRLRQWWIAPAASTVLGNALDTLVFFSMAFYNSTDAFMATHWPQIALVDYGFKIVICTLFFLPAYGVLLHYLTARLTAVRASQPLAARQHG